VISLAVANSTITKYRNQKISNIISWDVRNRTPTCPVSYKHFTGFSPIAVIQ